MSEPNVEEMGPVDFLVVEFPHHRGGRPRCRPTTRPP
jgi:hypothetical protein